MTFRTGQKVVCVDASPPRHGGKRRLVLHAIYTVRGIDPECADDGIYLFEMPDGPIPPGYKLPRGWLPCRFRHAVECKTDISIFTAMLKTERSPVMTEQR